MAPAEFFQVLPASGQPCISRVVHHRMQDVFPLIVTLTLDDASSRFFTALRNLHFPSAINYLAAHLTLFHHLPPTETSIRHDLAAWSADNKRLLLEVSEVRSIGRGVVYKITCPPLLQLHKQMQEKWQCWLIPQDRQKLWPHITVQNKVMPAEAKQTLEKLRASFRPFTAMGQGFTLWRYEGGPWKLLEQYWFSQP